MAVCRAHAPSNLPGLAGQATASPALACSAAQTCSWSCTRTFSAQWCCSGDLHGSFMAEGAARAVALDGSQAVDAVPQRTACRAAACRAMERSARRGAGTLFRLCVT